MKKLQNNGMTLAKEILKSLRGRQSAGAFSQRIGYKSNQVSRWESGHSRFSWIDFLDLSGKLKFPIAEVLKDYEYQGEPGNIQQLFSFLLPGRSQAQIASTCKVSVLTVQRWYKGQSAPSADLILQIFKISGTPLAPLLHRLFQNRKMTAHLSSLLQQEEDSVAAMLENPWTIAIACRCLHQDLRGLQFEIALRQVAKSLAVEIKTLKETVQRLLRAKLLAFSSEENYFYLPEGPAHFEFRNDYLSFVRGAQFWLRYSQAVLDSKKNASPGEDHVSYLVFNLKSAQIHQVHEKIIALYKEIASLSEENEKSNLCDRTFSFNMLLHRVDGPVFGELIKNTSKK